MEEVEILDVAAPSHESPHLSPVLGRYFERSWSHGEGHRLYDTAGNAYLDFANGIAVTALGHHHPAVTAAIHAQADRLIGPTGAMGYSEPVKILARKLVATLPPPIDTIFFLNSGSEAIEAALKLARRVDRPAGDHRLPGRVPRPDARGDLDHELEPQLPGGLRAAPAVGLPHPVPGGLPRLRRRRGAGHPDVHGRARAPHELGRARRERRGDLHRADPGRGRLLARSPALPARAARLLRRARDPARGRRDPDRLRPDRPDVGVRARRDRPGRRLHRQGDRKRAAAVGAGHERELQERWGKSAHGTTYGGNPVACAAGIAVLETIEREGLVANAAARGERAPGGSRAVCRPRTPGSATSAVPG